MTIIRAAVVQDAPCAFDRERSAAKAVALIAAAAAQGAQLAFFRWFGSGVWERFWLFGYLSGFAIRD